MENKQKKKHENWLSVGNMPLQGTEEEIGQKKRGNI